jgi:hypothetical protein
MYLVRQFLQSISSIFFDKLINRSEEVIRFAKKALFLKDVPNVHHLVLYKERSDILLVQISCIIEIWQYKPANKNQFQCGPKRKPVEIKHVKILRPVVNICKLNQNIMHGKEKRNKNESVVSVK